MTSLLVGTMNKSMGAEPTPRECSEGNLEGFDLGDPCQVIDKQITDNCVIINL